MLRRFWAGVAFLFATQAWGLDDASQKLADRYFAVLAGNPGQSIAFDRLWKIYADAGETPQLLTQARSWAAEHPVLAARLLQKGGQAAEARTILEPRAKEEVPAALLLSGWIEQGDGSLAAATALEKWGLRDPQIYVLLGELWSRAQQPDKARAAWNEAVALSPHDLVLRQRLAAVAIASAHLDEALAHWRVIAQEGSPTERLVAWEEIATRCGQAERWDEAITAQEKAIAMLGPGHWKLEESQQRLVALYLKAGRLADLESRWVQEASGNNPAAVLRLVNFYAARQDDAARIRWLRRAVELAPRDVGLQRQLAQSELAAGHLPEAAAVAEKLQAQNPNDIDTVFLLAEIAALSGDEGRAGSLVEKIAGEKADEGLQLRAQDFYNRLHLNAPLERTLQGTVRRSPQDVEAGMALARFYLGQKKFPEAATALEQFPMDRLSPEEAATVALRFSDLMREAKLEGDALHWAQIAWQKHPTAQAGLSAAELLDVLHRRPEALAQAEKSARLKALPEEALDRRLYTSLQAYQPEDDKVESGRGLARAIIADLQKDAIAGGSDQAWLRLVRWRKWNDDRIAAEESCYAGLKLYPQSQGLQSALVDLLLADGKTDAGIEALRRLAVLAPERTLEIERRIGHLELDRARPDEAEKIFRGILADHPGDWSAMADIAISQQGGGFWFEALDTWLKAWDLAPVESRRTMRASILGVASRLQLQSRGLAFLENAVLQERDTAVRLEILREAAVFAREQNVRDAWQSVLERHMAEKGAPSYWREGLAEAYRENGMFAEAKDTLAGSEEAQLPSTWEFLLKTAEQEGDLIEAARLAGLLARQETGSRPGAWTRLASLQERAGQWDEARATWNTLAVRMARDPEVLLGAADFFQRRGDRVQAEFYRRAALRLESPSPSVLLRLGRSASARLDRDQAVSDFELLLSSSQADSKAYPNCLPWPMAEKPSNASSVPADMRLGAFSRVGDWAEPSESDPEGCRLLAIKALARLLANSPKKKQWLAGFSHPAERIWAHYFSGEVEEALRLIQEMTPMPKEAFVVLSLYSGQGRGLAKWANTDLERWSAVTAGMGFLLDQKWQPSIQTLAEIYRDAPPIRRWEAAQELASHQYYRLALPMAQMAAAEFPAPQLAGAYLEMAEWQVALRDPARAREFLDLAIRHSEPTISYSKTLFSALHARWLLTPPEEREALREAVVRQLEESGHERSAAAAQALLLALGGNPERATEHLHRAFPADDLSLGRGWFDLIQQGGAQLEQWELHRLARDLYRVALARDRVLLSLRDETFQRLSEASLLQSSLFTASPAFARYLVAEWKARGVSSDELLQAARRLFSMGQDDKATEIVQGLCREDPKSDALVMGVFSLGGQRSLYPALTAYADRIASRPDGSPLSRNLAVQATLRLASLARQDGDYATELKLLENLKGDAATTPAIVLSRGQALCRQGRPKEALELIERAAQSGDPAPYAFALAELYTSLGREREAVSLLRNQLNAPPTLRLTAANRLQDLAAVLGDNESLAAARKVLADSPVGGLSRPKGEIIRPQTLAELDQKYPSPSERFSAGTQWLLGQKDVPPEIRRQELSRLSGIVQDSPDLASRYYVFRTSLARQNGTLAEWEQELIPEWKGGSYFAGEILLQLYLEQGRQADLEKVLDRYLTAPNFRLIAWQQLARDLLKHGENQLAERVLVAMGQYNDGDASRDLLLAEAREKQQRPAKELVSAVETLVAVNPALRLPLARYYLAVKDFDQARRHLDQVSEAEVVDAEASAAWADLADQLLTAGRIDDTKSALAAALRRSPSSVPADLVVRYEEARGNAPMTNEFALAPADLSRIELARINRLREAGRDDEILAIFEKHPLLLNSPEMRPALEKSEARDWGRTSQIWAQIEEQKMLWDVQAAAAQFHARRAATLDKTDELYLTELSLAHKLDPGNFRLASDLANELVRRGKSAQAVRVLETAAKSFGSAADRRDARRMLESLQVSLPLPKMG